MANHCVANLPWTPEPEVAMLWARTCIKAAYGGVFKETKEFSKTDFCFESPNPHIQLHIWMSAPRSVELRRSHPGLSESASIFLQETMGRGFGALSACDEGIGVYELPEPLPIDLDGITWLGRLMENQSGVKKEKTPVYDGFYGEALGAIPRESFGPLGLNYWVNKFDWEEVLGTRFGKKMTSGQATSAALVACSHGLNIPKSAIKALAPSGAARAMSVAFAWGNQSALESLRPLVPENAEDLAVRWARSKIKRAYKNEPSAEKDARLAKIEALSQAGSIGYALSSSDSIRRKTPRM